MDETLVQAINRGVPFTLGITDCLIKALPENFAGDLPIEMQASNPRLDLEGESVPQGPDMLDVSYFIGLGTNGGNGSIRWGHTLPGEQVVPIPFCLGYPLECRTGQTEFLIKGFLYRKGFGSAIGVPLWEGMRDNPQTHKFKPSIEGHKMADSSGQLRKAFVKRVAISDTVINPFTWLRVPVDAQGLSKAIMAASNELGEAYQGNERTAPQNRQGDNPRTGKPRRKRRATRCAKDCPALHKALNGAADPVRAAMRHLFYDHNQAPEEAAEFLAEIAAGR